MGAARAHPIGGDSYIGNEKDEQSRGRNVAGTTDELGGTTIPSAGQLSIEVEEGIDEQGQSE